MLEPIYLPEHVAVDEENERQMTFSIYPYFPGYGPTVGNALRRVLLSSLPGAAITHVKIEGVDHEFSTLAGVKEDMVTLLLNLKRVRLASTIAEPVDMTLEAKGLLKVTARDFEAPTGIAIINPASPIATLTDKKATLKLTCTVEQGRGYVPAEAREHEQRPIGTIALDAIFTPVERVSFRVENVRVGQATDYHKLIMTISTDGTITPLAALRSAASILADHFKELTGDFTALLTAPRPTETPAAAPAEAQEAQAENTLNLLQLPSRVHNALERVGITTVEQVLDLTDEQIQDVPGLGEKAVQDILNAREKYQAASAAQALEKEA
ncbi:MAG: DNA-directed RNA polymerase subunit alpha [Candidatus Andersenbacteria bacterium]|nr:DNA-directed RNA polymerase subunit alpha [Candidatus Andersenbacteria bacterium]